MMRYLFSSFTEDETLNTEILCRHELLTYVRLFSQHYIFVKSSAGQKKLKASVDSKRLPFTNETPICCGWNTFNEPADDLVLHHLHQTLSIHHIVFCRQIVIEALFGKKYDDLLQQKYSLVISELELKEKLKDFKL